MAHGGRDGARAARGGRRAVCDERVHRLDIPGFPPTYDDSLECNGFTNGTERVAWRAALAECLALQSWSDCIVVLADLASRAAHYSCYNASATSGFAFSQLAAFNANLTRVAPPPPPGALLYTAVGNWASSDESVALGFLAGSSLLDEEWSGFNAYLLGAVRAGAYRVVPWFSVNNVCQGGNELKDALRAPFWAAAA